MHSIEDQAMAMMVQMLGSNFAKRESSIGVGKEKAFRLLIEMKALKQAEDRTSQVRCHWCGEFGDREYNDAGELCCRCRVCHSLVPVKAESLRLWTLDRDWLVSRMKACLGLISDRTVEMAQGITLLGTHEKLGIFLVDRLEDVAMNANLLSAMRDHGPDVAALVSKRSCRPGSAPEGIHPVFIENVFYFKDGKLNVCEPYFAQTRIGGVPHPVNGPFSQEFDRYFYSDGTSVDFTDDQAFFFMHLWEAGGDWRHASVLMPHYDEGLTKPYDLFKPGKRDAGYPIREKRFRLYKSIVVSNTRGEYRLVL